jgi:hypothetical protein
MLKNDGKIGNDDPIQGDLAGPIEGHDAAGADMQARKRKRRMLVDEILELGQKEISRALKDTSDIVINLDRVTLVSDQKSDRLMDTRLRTLIGLTYR